MNILNVLLPVMLLIATGAALGRIRLWGSQFLSDLNKLVFWVALPSLIFRSCIRAGSPTAQTFLLVGVVAAVTALVAALAWIVAGMMRLPRSSCGTFIQVTFAGNLAYIGIPVIAHSIGHVALAQAPELIASSIVIVTAMVIMNNVMAVALLHKGKLELLPLVRHVSLNPLVLSGCLGMLLGIAGVKIPFVFDQVLQTVGGTAVPLALFCIGGSLASVPIRGRLSWIAVAAFLKVFLFPLLALLFVRALGLNLGDSRVVLILCACPTAAFCYTLARELDGDESLAAGAISASTMASFISLAVVLAITHG